MNKKLFGSWVHTLKAPKMDKYERATILDEYMKENQVSQRELGRRFDIPHNTVQDWLLPLRVSESEYKDLARKGYSSTDVYRLLRNNKDVDVISISNIEKHLLVTIDKLNSKPQSKFCSDKVTKIVEDLKTAIRTFEFHLENRTKK